MAEMKSNLLQSQSSKLTSFQRTRISADYSRSRNPTYSSISKTDDVTRFNSFNNRVSFYKDYPNRSGTPIKIHRETTSQGFRKQLPVKTQQVQDLFRQSSDGTASINSDLYQKAMQANLKVGSGMPQISQQAPANANFIMNDYHCKQTNPGFGRNALGGFFTK